MSDIRSTLSKELSLQEKAFSINKSADTALIGGILGSDVNAESDSSIVQGNINTFGKIPVDMLLSDTPASPKRKQNNFALEQSAGDAKKYRWTFDDLPFLIKDDTLMGDDNMTTGMPFELPGSNNGIGDLLQVDSGLSQLPQTDMSFVSQAGSASSQYQYHNTPHFAMFSTAGNLSDGVLPAEYDIGHSELKMEDDFTKIKHEPEEKDEEHIEWQRAPVSQEKKKIIENQDQELAKKVHESLNEVHQMAPFLPAPQPMEPARQNILPPLSSLASSYPPFYLPSLYTGTNFVTSFPQALASSSTFSAKPTLHNLIDSTNECNQESDEQLVFKLQEEEELLSRDGEVRPSANLTLSSPSSSSSAIMSSWLPFTDVNYPTDFNCIPNDWLIPPASGFNETYSNVLIPSDFSPPNPPPELGNEPQEEIEIFERRDRPLSVHQTEDELRNLLASIPSDDLPPPEDRTGTPQGLKPNLMEHQKVGVGWMMNMEKGPNKGGILADDMGLGKTIQSLALILARPGPSERRTTLVVTAVSLVHQWAQEVRLKTTPDVLSIYIYHGSKRSKDPTYIMKHDVVITTYSIVSLEHNRDVDKEVEDAHHGTLLRCNFHRVILDEAQVIKNKSTRAALACCSIDATHRWCLSATPIQNNITELYSLIKFLRIKPYCTWDNFREKIDNPMKNGKHQLAIRRVQAVLKAIFLRRTKKDWIDGQPILRLPERTINIVETDFPPEQRDFYDHLEKRTLLKFNKYLEAGTAMRNYSNILVLLLRLRQACDHPRLIKDTERVPADQINPTDPHNLTQIARSMAEAVVRRLLEEEAVAECPICMDAANDAVLVHNCGHMYCRECLMNHINHHIGQDDKLCPECRGPVSLTKLVSVEVFNRVHRIEPDPFPPLENEADVKGKGPAKEGEPSNLPNIDEWVSSGKIDKIMTILENIKLNHTGEKTVLFSQFTGFLDLMEKPLKNSGIKFLRYDGSMDVQKRSSVVTRMHEDATVTVMLVSMKCGSLGLNLTCANHVILTDPWWNPALDNQAIDRVHRIGQTKDVQVHRILVPNTVEDRIMALQKTKQEIADGALGEGGANKIGRLGLNDLIFLFTGN